MLHFHTPAWFNYIDNYVKFLSTFLYKYFKQKFWAVLFTT